MIMPRLPERDRARHNGRMSIVYEVFDHGVARAAIEARREERHDARIGIHRRKGVAIRVAPATQPDAAAG